MIYQPDLYGHSSVQILSIDSIKVFPCRHQLTLLKTGTTTEQLIVSRFYSPVPKSGKWISVLGSCRDEWDRSYGSDSSSEFDNSLCSSLLSKLLISERAQER